MFPKLWFGAGSAVRSAISSPSTADWLIPGICLIIQAETPTVVAFERAGKPRIMNREQYQALIARYGDE